MGPDLNRFAGGVSLRKGQPGQHFLLTETLCRLPLSLSLNCVRLAREGSGSFPRWGSRGAVPSARVRATAKATCTCARRQDSLAEYCTCALCVRVCEKSRLETMSRREGEERVLTQRRIGVGFWTVTEIRSAGVY